MSWSLEYPAAVAAIPPLAAAIRAGFDKHKAANLAAAKEDKAWRDKEGVEFHAYDQGETYAVAGESSALLSVTNDWYAFTGGAHPNHGTAAILWDKAAGTKVKLDTLVVGGAAVVTKIYRAAYCRALDKQRAERRKGLDMSTDPADPFNQCPRFDELSIIPKGSGKGGAMTSLQFHADPYTAGPYAEGDYDVELPVTAAFVAVLKPGYRASFAARP